MTLGTMDGKTPAAEQPSVTVITQAQDSSGSAAGKKSRVTRKHVIIGVTCAVIVAMVIAGVLVGVKFHLDSTNNLVTRTFEFNTKDQDDVKEDVGADVKANYVQYHLTDDDSEVWVIDDFNRELQVMKITHDGESACFIATLNTSNTALPSAVLNATATDEILEADETYYEVSETSIKDKSMLGTHGQELCDNLDVYWTTPTCDVDISDMEDEIDSTEHSRQKRGLRKWWKKTWGKVKKKWRRVRCWLKNAYSCYKCVRDVIKDGKLECGWHTCIRLFVGYCKQYS